MRERERTYLLHTQASEKMTDDTPEPKEVVAKDNEENTIAKDNKKNAVVKDDEKNAVAKDNKKSEKRNTRDPLMNKDVVGIIWKYQCIGRCKHYACRQFLYKYVSGVF